METRNIHLRKLGVTFLALVTGATLFSLNLQYILTGSLETFQKISKTEILICKVQENVTCKRRRIEEEMRWRFLVATETCQILDMNPFDPTVLRYLENNTIGSCSPSLIASGQKGVKYDSSHKDYKTSVCCFKEIHRVTQDPNKYDMDADNGFRISSNCTPISKSNVTLPTSEFLQILCQAYDANGLQLVTGNTTDYHAIVFSPEKHSDGTKRKTEYWRKFSDSEGINEKLKPPSVLILGVDSTSRLHMIRSIPKIKRFLESNDFIEMKGYTKIGENTFPNIMGSMGGMRNFDYPCAKPMNMMDDCPFIWKGYNLSNYVTALVEDDALVAIFNYKMAGFVEQPTDYYLRPSTLAYYLSSRGKAGCQNGMSQTEFLMTYIRNFVLNMATSDVPYFLLSWFTTLTHGDINALKPAEPTFYNMLRDLISDASLKGNNTVILFISDHGYRFGSYRKTFMGYYEESLPFFFIRLPPHLKSSHPHWYQNLKKNSPRLTSPLDLHATLEDILSLSSPLSEFKYTHSNWEPNFRPVYSLFEKTPLNRTCSSSGIPEEYCRCGAKPSLPNNPSVPKEFGLAVISSVNKILAEKVQQGLCISLKFQKLLYARKLQVGKMRDSLDKSVKFTEHLVAIEASPSGAWFEGRVRVFENETIVTRGDISRINAYGEQSGCLTEPKLMRYCYCRDYHAYIEAEKKPKQGQTAV